MSANDIRKAQKQLDQWRAEGHDIWLWRGELQITSAEPSAQRLVQLAKYAGAIRMILGDNGKANSWAVQQLEGGTLLYQHPTMWREPEPAGEVITMSFGKYRGAPVAIVVDDVPYCEWLLEQSWFAEKFPQHRKYLADALHRTRNDAEGPSAA